MQQSQRFDVFAVYRQLLLQPQDALDVSSVQERKGELIHAATAGFLTFIGYLVCEGGGTVGVDEEHAFLLPSCQ